mmetsp:Transcript_3370/g.3560  ORF Transcript_3370/g.3560 Transcript_3370/m.3560 type:complete len:1048 (+) Transcript_3370:95-3238(+)
MMIPIRMMMPCWFGVVSLLLLVLPSYYVPRVSSLPAGFVKELIVNTPAVTGTWATNPRSPEGKSMLILASKTGTIKVLENPDESDKVFPILDLRFDQKDLCTNGERGVQGIAIHPQFDTNGFVYLLSPVYVEGCPEKTDDAPWNIVARFRMNPTTLQLDPKSKKVIWRGGKTYKNVHNGGAMAFVIDDKLYVTTGDSGDGTTVQPLSNVHGSIIRLNEDGSVPNDNPFADPDDYPHSYRCADTGGYVPKDAPDTAICAEVFANGLRNPFRMAMDPNEHKKVKFHISDVGGAYWEELDWGGDDFRGRNYGYPIHEGPCLHGHSNRCQLPGDKNILEPFHWYAHRSIQEGGCISGATTVPQSAGWPSDYTILYADFLFHEIYQLFEETQSSCRACRPPQSNYQNATFYQIPKVEGRKKGGITDMFFGPYKDTQALYVIARDGTEQVTRIRYTEDVDNTPPIPIIILKDLNYQYTVGELFEFDGSTSTDAEGGYLEYAWNFDDGTTSTKRKPTHTFEEPGKYKVKLVVTDTSGLSQQTSTLITIGQPPTVTIVSPRSGEEFSVGQIFTLQGEAFDFEGKRLEESQLSWEVRKHHAEHYHPFLDPMIGNNITLFPAPEPEDFFASTNSYLRVILTATDTEGLTTVVERVIQPWKITVEIDSVPPGIEVVVDLYPLTTSEQIVSWNGHHLSVLAKDQPPYEFRSWWDGKTNRARTIQLSDSNQPTVLALYCAQEYWFCTSDEECCSESCVSMSCTSTSMLSMSLSENSSSMVEEAKGVVSHQSAPEEEDTDTDTDPESAAKDPEFESSEDSKKEASSEDDEEEFTQKRYYDDKKFLEKDVTTDLDVGGTDLEGGKAQEVSKTHHDKIEGTVLSIGDDNDEEETNNDVSSSSQTTVLPADVQSDVEMVETTANAGVRIIGIIVAIILSCLICIVIVKCFSNATSMKEQRRIPSTFSSSNSFPQLGSVLEKISMFLKTNATDEFPSHQRDEENGTSSNSHENSNVTSTATTTMPAATRVAAVKSVDSTSAWVEDVLNETYETQSSSSSSYHSTL